jgi:NitT/TauT family transport system substrate-binding protein
MADGARKKTVRTKRQRILLISLIASAITLFNGWSARCEDSEVRIGVQFGLIYLPVTVADAEGFFAQEATKAGLKEFKVTILRFSGTPAINDALFSGSVDLGSLGAPGLLIAWDKTHGKQDLAGLAALGANPFILETIRPDLRSFTDLNEQDRIAVPATTSPQAIVMRMAAEKFYGPGQYARVDPLLVSMPHPDATIALLAGRALITAYVATPPFIAALRKSDKIHAVIASKDILEGEEATGVVLSGFKQFVDRNPTTAKVIVAALEDAMDFIAKNPDQAADVYLKSEVANMPKDEVTGMLTDGSIIYSVTPTGIMKFARFMAKTGQIKNEPKSWQEVFFSSLGSRNGS